MIRGLLLVAAANTLAMAGLLLFGVWMMVTVNGLPAQVKVIQTTLQSMQGDLKTDTAQLPRPGQ